MPLPLPLSPSEPRSSIGQADHSSPTTLIVRLRRPRRTTNSTTVVIRPLPTFIRRRGPRATHRLRRRSRTCSHDCAGTWRVVVEQVRLHLGGVARGPRRRLFSQPAPGTSHPARAREQVHQLVARQRPEKVEEPPAERSRLGADDTPRLRRPRPGHMHQRVEAPCFYGRTVGPTTQVHNGLPRTERPVGRRGALSPEPASYAYRRRARRQDGRQRIPRRRECPPVRELPDQTLDEASMVNLAGEVGVLPVQPGVARIRRIRIPQPERPTAGNTHCPPLGEAMRSLTAASRAVERVRSGTASNRSVTPPTDPCMRNFGHRQQPAR